MWRSSQRVIVSVVSPDIYSSFYDEADTERIFQETEVPTFCEDEAELFSPHGFDSP